MKWESIPPVLPDVYIVIHRTFQKIEHLLFPAQMPNEHIGINISLHGLYLSRD